MFISIVFNLVRIQCCNREFNINNSIQVIYWNFDMNAMLQGAALLLSSLEAEYFIYAYHIKICHHTKDSTGYCLSALVSSAFKDCFLICINQNSVLRVKWQKSVITSHSTRGCVKNNSVIIKAETKRALR